MDSSPRCFPCPTAWDKMHFMNKSGKSLETSALLILGKEGRVCYCWGHEEVTSHFWLFEYMPFRCHDEEIGFF